MDRTEFLTQLKRPGNYVEFPPYSELWAPAPDIVANTVRLLISPSERIHCAIQFEEWTRTDDERQHDVTWHLATDRALLRVEISARSLEPCGRSVPPLAARGRQVDAAGGHASGGAGKPVVHAHRVVR